MVLWPMWFAIDATDQQMPNWMKAVAVPVVFLALFSGIIRIIFWVVYCMKIRE